MEIVNEFKNDLGMDCVTIKSDKHLFSSSENRWFKPNEEVTCLKQNLDKYHEYDTKPDDSVITA